MTILVMSPTLAPIVGFCYKTIHGCFGSIFIILHKDIFMSVVTNETSGFCLKTVCNNPIDLTR